MASATRTPRAHNPPQRGINTLPVLALDAGNRFIKWLPAGGRPRCIPSFVKPLEPWEDACSDELSVILEVGGQRYAIGQVAQHLGGNPTFQHDKCELASLLCLAAIEPPKGNQIAIDKLIVALPDSRKSEAVAGVRRCKGAKTFIRNGQTIHATIKQVEPIDETRAAYSFALKKRLFQYARTNGILDLGGGTGIGRLYTPNGTLIRQADVIVPGTYALATKIAAALIPQLGHSPDLSLLMDAIAQGIYQYGTTGVDFQPIFEKCRAEWLTEIRAQLKSAWTQWLSELGEVLIIGGSAPLAESLEQQSSRRFRLAPDPQLFNLYGMGG